MAYADDITHIVTKKEEIKEFFGEINTFCMASGAKVNKEKTE